ncbi:MAG TPA: DUF1203 domain-containing protein [Puia sp.]|nr:DUF1203 domain-containing protein [Puia sp.]
MKPFKIVPLSNEWAKKIRAAGQDEFGHPVVEEAVTSGGPCRITLRQFKPGVDKRLVISHSPFEIDNAYNQPGPIYISPDDVEEYQDVHRFPPEIKRITLIGYNTDQWMVFTRVVGEQENIDEVIARVLDENPKVAYLHARSTTACCYLCRIERG